MRHLLAGIVATTALNCTLAASVVPAPVGLKAEYQTDPLGLGLARPRLSWELVLPDRGARQTAYEIQAAATAEDLEHGEPLRWDSREVNSDQSVLVPYGGPPLGSAQRVYWRVRVRDGRGAISAWSRAALFETGLLQASDWQAQWITPGFAQDPSKSEPAPMLRGAFQVHGRVREARLYITSLGLYSAQLNGHEVGDQLLTPGWTDYDQRIEVQTYDVTGLVRDGGNALGVTLADGWYRGVIGGAGVRNWYGPQLAVLAELRVVHADGSVQVVGTDSSWRSTTGPVRAADLYNGETYDARLERPGWTEPGYDDAGWQGVAVLDHTKGTLFAGIDPPVRRTGELHPVSVAQAADGGYIFDLGQNMVGWVRMVAQGAAGTVITLRYAEVLDRAGNLYTANLRTA